MADHELINRLKRFATDLGSDLVFTAADRIEELVKERDAGYDVYAGLEAKLAKAVEALQRVVGYYDQVNPFRQADYHNESCDCDRCRFDRARVVLAELEGKK